MSDQELSRRLEVACRIARQAGQLVMQYHSATIPVQRKSDDSPVTVADREAELLLRREIEVCVSPGRDCRRRTRAENRLIDATAGSWIRSTEPSHSLPAFRLFGTLIGVQRDEESLIGVIELPGLESTYPRRHRSRCMVASRATHRRNRHVCPHRPQLKDCRFT